MLNFREKMFRFLSTLLANIYIFEGLILINLKNCELYWNQGVTVGQVKNYSVFLRFHNQAKLLGVKEEKYGFNLRTRLKCIQKLVSAY